jgi:hypothetical protein
MRYTMFATAHLRLRIVANKLVCGTVGDERGRENSIMLNHDLELNRAHIQALSNRDALAAFFADLGYDTNARLVQHVNAMGITNETLRSNITHIERLASQEAGLFEVYLFELKSVTMALTQALVRSFRNRPGDYLLVLVDSRQPYEQLDFVLVQRYSSETSKSTPPDGLPVDLIPAPKQVGVYPRILTVQRRKPSMIALRVLRRFSYTEQDTFAQYDKLLSAYDTADWSEPYFNNRALFSDYYLTQRLPHEAIWKQEEKSPALVRSYQRLRDLYAGVRDLPNRASVIRARLLEPTLSTLGFQFKAGKGESTVTPTYLLYAQDVAANTQPLALCLAYQWGRNLDGRDDRDEEAPDENPGANVVTLLDSGQAEWAIVTNGKIWRLYAAKAHSRATNYYEIDLEETLVLPDAERATAYLYFWLFFRAASFTSTATERSFLDTLVSESERYARELGENLKNRVFDEIFLHFARGFLSHAQREGLVPALETLTPEEQERALEPFLSGTLTFLYRLLFLLYAESRDLLPVREEIGYGPHSLERIKSEIAEHAKNVESETPKRIKTAYGAMSTGLYERLQALFAAVDQGNAQLNVPVYNGGLFMTNPDPVDTSPETAVARFLATHKIPDRELALGLDRMARDVDEKRQELVFIDYKSLGVRQLGSIYEGLLEFKLRIAPEKMAYVKGKKTEEIIPYAEAQQKKLSIIRDGRGKDAAEKTLAKGALYLENDRRERKATGSYYTPGYIVKYIIEQTVGPVLKEKLEALRPLFREAEQYLKNEHNKADTFKKQRLTAKSSDTPEQATYIHYRDRLNERFFDLRVLDPAMGSGHFLVEAVDYITDQLAKFLAAFRWSPVLHELAETRREIQAEMERQDVTIDISKLTDLNLLKRRVLKSCIYGVDLNQMAVELAKVSLWLDCFTLGAPLSFLDHHMKCGNSLIGGNVDDVQQLLSSGLWSNQFAYLLDATHLMRRVSERADITAREVAQSRQEYRRAYDALAPFKRLLDIWLSEYFGVKSAKEAARMYTTTILSGDYSETNKEDREAIDAASKLAADKRFFHWELEFPEVFFDREQRKPDGGFDAVVGNPPYVRQEGLGDDKVAFKALYQVFNSIADLYTYFIERGHMMLRPCGRFGMITANKFMRANYGAALRSFMIEKIKLEKLIDFGDLPVFGDATTYPLIILSSRALRNGNAIEYALLKSLTFESLPAVIQSHAQRMPESAFTGTNWSLAIGTEQAILDKLKANAIPLGEYVDGKIQYGIKTGFNEAFVIDRETRDRLIAEDARSAEIIKPFVVGEDVRKYALDFHDRYLIWTYIGVPMQKYPAIYKHLQRYQAQLEKRWDKGNHWWELRHCDYYADFEKPKIIYPNICIQPEFTFDPNGYYSNQKTFIIPIPNTSLLSVLNSNIMNFLFNAFLPKLRGGFFEPGYVFMKDIPTRRINFVTSDKDRAYYREKGKLLYLQCMVKEDYACVLGFVERHLSLQPEQSDVVHDLLAFLAEEMLRLNREKRAHMEEFLDWLETMLKPLPNKDGRKGIETLTGKSKLLDYIGNYQKSELALTFEELLELLRKNRTRLGVSLSDAAFIGALRERYEQSLAHALPLKEQLAKTDRLIDLVVYRLYGLTEEEIAVVEGRG